MISTMNLTFVDALTDADLEAAHKGRIGSSAICTVAGLNPYQTPLQLWMEKTGKSPRTEYNNAMWLGTKLEPIVAELAMRHRRERYWKNSLCAVSKEKEWMVSTPDYFIVTGPGAAPDTIMEIKTTSAFQKQRWEEGIPDYAHCQVQWQMGMWGIEHAEIACLAGGRDLIVKECKFEKDIFEQLVELGEKFMHFIRTDTPPEARADDLDAVKQLFSPTAGKTIVCGPEMEGLARQYVEHKSEITKLKELCKPHEATIKTISARIIQILGDAEIAEGGGIRIERKISQRKGYAVAPTTVDSLKIKTAGDEAPAE